MPDYSLACHGRSVIFGGQWYGLIAAGIDGGKPYAIVDPPCDAVSDKVCGLIRQAAWKPPAFVDLYGRDLAR